MTEPSSEKNQRGGVTVDLAQKTHVSQTKKWVLDPQPTDIICGRGARVTHPGNQRFRRIVLQRKGEYQHAKRREDKTRITLDIVRVLLGGSTPARFLLKDSEKDLWYDVGMDYAKEKVSHALRSRPSTERRKRSKPKRGSGSSSKVPCPPELEQTVHRLICDQQQLLESMIRREVLPMAAAANVPSTLLQNGGFSSAYF